MPFLELGYYPVHLSGVMRVQAMPAKLTLSSVSSDVQCRSVRYAVCGTW